MKRLIAIAAVVIAGCAAPIERHSEVIDGQRIDFRDADDGTMPCQGVHQLGCEQMIRDIPTIWLSRVAGESIKHHEIGHALGMQHTTFDKVAGGGCCATVTKSGGGYVKGQRICVVGNEESIL